MVCNCSPLSPSSVPSVDFTFDSVRLDDKLVALNEIAPFAEAAIPLSGEPNPDVQLHRFRGSHQGLPLESLELFSAPVADAEDGTAARRFFGRIGETSIDYTYAATFDELGRLVSTITLHDQGGGELESLTITYDVAKQWIVAVDPPLPDPEAEPGARPSFLHKMLDLSGGNANPTMLISIPCVLKVVFGAGGLCAVLFAGCVATPPACVAIIPAYLACVGPAVAAAILAC